MRLGKYELTGECTCRWGTEPHHDECPLSAAGAYASVLASLHVAEEALAGGVQVVATLLDADNPIDWRPAREWAEAADVLLQGADK
jgi:hypothetical protein